MLAKSTRNLPSRERLRLIAKVIDGVDIAEGKTVAGDSRTLGRIYGDSLDRRVPHRAPQEVECFDGVPTGQSCNDDAFDADVLRRAASAMERRAERGYGLRPPEADRRICENTYSERRNGTFARIEVQVAWALYRNGGLPADGWPQGDRVVVAWILQNVDYLSSCGLTMADASVSASAVTATSREDTDRWAQSVRAALKVGNRGSNYGSLPEPSPTRSTDS